MSINAKDPGSSLGINATREVREPGAELMTMSFGWQVAHLPLDYSDIKFIFNFYR